MPVVVADPALRSDPARNFKFHVSFTKKLAADEQVVMTGGFMSVSGFGVNTEPIPYREGGLNTTTRKLPGQSEFQQIQLQRGIFTAAEGAQALWYWMKEIFYHVQGQGYGSVNSNFRTDVHIRLGIHPVTYGPGSDVTRGGEPAAAKIHIYNAWPTSINYSDLDAGGNAVAVEQLVLAHEGFDIRFARSHTGTSWTDAAGSPNDAQY